MNTRLPGRRRLPLALACVAVPWLGSAAAAEWSVQAGLQARAGTTEEQPQNDNRPATRLRDGRVSGNLNLVRSVENASTRFDTSLDLPVTGLAPGRNVLGRLALGQTFAATLDSLSGGLDLTVDDNRASSRSASDELIGPRRRITTGGNVSWQHQISNRWAAQAQVGATRTRLGSGSTTAENFRDARWGASANYRWDELLRLSLQVSRSRFDLDSGDSTSKSDSLSLSASRALDETSTASLSVGAYRSQRLTTLRGLACPLPVSFCNAGLVAPVPVTQQVESPSSGSQYSLSYQRNLGERTGLGLTAGRQLSGTGLGLVQADSASANLNHALTPHINGSLVASWSRSTSPGLDNGPEPRVRALEGSFSWAMAERLTLSASASVRRFREPSSNTAVKSTQISITLQYQGPKILAAR